MYDCVIIGGGVIGLSLAWRLAEAGLRVSVVERGALGKATSWTGAGMLPPPERRSHVDPLESLRTLSHDLYPDWSRRLLELTGIDNGFRQCGAIYVARSVAEAVSLRAAMLQRADEQVDVQPCERSLVQRLESTLSAVALSQVRTAYHLPQECMVRNPRHLQALEAACRLRNVTFMTDCEVIGFRHRAGRMEAVHTAAGELTAGHFCVASGTWSGELLRQLGWELPIRPWRGQMLLWKTEQPLLARIVYEGLRYFVPRDDGHLLVGATVEDVGFDCRTTEVALADLIEFAREWLPELRLLMPVSSWAGLRPGTADGLPYMGRVPDFDNLFVAAGHFRSGLHLAPITGEVMAELILGQNARCDLTPFRLSR